MAEFNLRMQKYHDGSILGLRIYMFTFWMSYQNKRFFESYWPAFKRSTDKKSFILIFLELLRLTVIWKCLPYHYFRYGLYQKKYSFAKILNYLPETVFYYQILPKINKQMFLLDDKNAFEEVIKGKNIKFPRTVLKITKGTLFDNISNVIKSESQLERIFKKTNSDIIFCKPSDCGSGGKDIVIFKKSSQGYKDLKGKNVNFNYLKKISSIDWILQEKVNNSQEIAAIHSNSTNSFRILTFFKPKEGSKAIYCILKAGNNNAYTDNAHTGGVYVKIDMKTGLLDETAYDENLYTYKFHPYSKYEFKGKKVKDIKKVVKLAEKLGNMFPNLTFVGWDIALTEKGAFVLEGNSSPGLTIIQRTYEGMDDFKKLVL